MAYTNILNKSPVSVVGGCQAWIEHTFVHPIIKGARPKSNDLASNNQTRRNCQGPSRIKEPTVSQTPKPKTLSPKPFKRFSIGKPGHSFMVEAGLQHKKAQAPDGDQTLNHPQFRV